MARLAGLTHGKIDHITAVKCGVQGVTSANAIHSRICCTKKDMRESEQRSFFVEPVHRQRHPARREGASDAVKRSSDIAGAIPWLDQSVSSDQLRLAARLLACDLSFVAFAFDEEAL